MTGLPERWMAGLATFLYSTGKFNQRDISRLWAEEGHDQGRVNEEINALPVYRDELDDFCPACRNILDAKASRLPLFDAMK